MMAKVMGEIRIVMGFRPCVFKGLEGCLFHGWFQRSKFLGGDQRPVGLVELPNGLMVEADPKEVRFLETDACDMR